MLGRTVEELGGSMSSAELAEWVAFDRAYSLPDTFTMAGVVAPAVANPWRARGARPLGPGDFLPYFADGTERRRGGTARTPAEHAALFRSLARRGRV
jgi:hypothetical protein